VHLNASFCLAYLANKTLKGANAVKKERFSWNSIAQPIKHFTFAPVQMNEVY
jgi:hypothetical protein